MLCPTISPTDTEDIAAELARHGVDSIDAPMSGGPKRAQDGSMSLMVACADVVFAAHQSLLNTLSSQVFKISQRVGDGARMKLCNNLLAGIHLAGAAEVFAMAERLGLDLNTVLQVVAQSSGQSWMASDRMPRALAADFAPRAHMSLLAKDTRLALDMAAAAGLTNTLGGPAAAAFAGAITMGLADLDDAALLAWARAQLDYAS
jgi:L-threonate 2-dehydrogenase